MAVQHHDEYQHPAGDCKACVSLLLGYSWFGSSVYACGTKEIDDSAHMVQLQLTSKSRRTTLHPLLCQAATLRDNNQYPSCMYHQSFCKVPGTQFSVFENQLCMCRSGIHTFMQIFSISCIAGSASSLVRECTVTAHPPFQSNRCICGMTAMLIRIC